MGEGLGATTALIATVGAKPRLLEPGQPPHRSSDTAIHLSDCVVFQRTKQVKLGVSAGAGNVRVPERQRKKCSTRGRSG